MERSASGEIGNHGRDRTGHSFLIWNIRHGAGDRVAAIVNRVGRHGPDVLVLAEFRSNSAGRRLRSGLTEIGFEHQFATSDNPRLNAVLVAAREPFAAKVPADPGPDVSRRLALVEFPTFNLVGVYFPCGEAKRPVFEFLLSLPAEYLQSASILCGDFNTGHHHLDEAGATFVATDRLVALERRGWIDAWRRIHGDKREFSWFSSVGNGFRVDHVFASPSMNERILDVRYSHSEREERLSDHSAMIVRSRGVG